MVDEKSPQKGEEGQKKTAPYQDPMEVLEGRLAEGERAARNPGFPDYIVTTHGRIFSTKRTELRELVQHQEPKGYLSVNMVGPQGARKTRRVHREVGLTFLGEPDEERPLVLHTDGDPTNNHIDNLRFGSYAENYDDRRRHGTDNAGSRNAMSIMTETTVLYARRCKLEGKSTKEIAEQFGIRVNTMRKALKGDTWGHVPMPSPLITAYPTSDGQTALVFRVASEEE